MIKLIVLDCDGTLLNSSGQITLKTRELLRNVIDKNIKVMLASARPFYRVVPFLRSLDTEKSDQYTISFNGGLVTNNTGTKTVLSCSFSEEQVLELINIGCSFQAETFLYSNNRLFSNRDDEIYRKDNPDANFCVADLKAIDFGRYPIFKITYVSSSEEKTVLRSRLPQYLFEKYEISESDVRFIEMANHGATKGNALKTVASRLGVLPNEIMAFGDQDNDISMIKYAGIGVAMGNAPQVVKNSADYVTTTNDEEGVANALERFLF